MVSSIERFGIVYKHLGNMWKPSEPDERVKSPCSSVNLELLLDRGGLYDCGALIRLSRSHHLVNGGVMEPLRKRFDTMPRH
jgi:hypothetical protein